MTRYVITLMASAEQQKLDENALRTARDNAHALEWEVAEPVWLAPGEACDIPIKVATGDAPGAAFAATLAGQLDAVDVVVQKDDAHRRKKLLVCDMDSTIIEQECIDELADFAGIKPEVAAITERAMRGELDFKAALLERVRLLKGLPVTVLERAYKERITFTPGAKELVATMRANGAQCLLVSGGFTYFTSQVREALGFHSDSANLLDVAHGELTGEVVQPILDKEAKLKSLKDALYRHDLQPADALAIGDGANDLPMLCAAGMGMAFHAKPVVREQASACLNHADLRGALYVQGYRKDEFTVP